MYIVTVIPLARGIAKENLTYFSLQNIPLGTVVVIEIRNKKIDAIVINKESLSQAKEAVKNSSFKLKKIISEKGPFILSGSFFRASIRAKDYFATTSGSFIFSVLPNIFLNSYSKIVRQPTEEKKDEIVLNLKTNKLILQANLEDRIDFYKKQIRQNFARNKSTLFVVPSISDAKYFWVSIKKGVEEFIYVLESNTSKKEYLNKINTLTQEKHSFVLITTPSHLYLASLLEDIETIIIEKESSPLYKARARPYVDFRIFAEMLAEESKKTIILADTITRTETMARVEKRELFEAMPISLRIKNNISKDLINIKEEWQKENKFFTLSQSLKNLIEETIKNKSRIFIFCLRRGVSGLVVCNDCKNTVECDKCHSPFSLYNTASRERILVCNKCKNKQNIATGSGTGAKCNNCQSWNLIDLGMGIDKIAEETKKYFPKVKILKIDKDSVKNSESAEKVASIFYKEDGIIMLGTEMALFYLKKQIPISAIASFDSLFAIPNFRINEKIMQILTELQNITTEKILIQTKNIDEQILKNWQIGNLSAFYRNELEDRCAFSYPPFSTIIKTSIEGSRSQIEKEKEKLINIFGVYKPNFIFSFSKKTRQKIVLQMIIKIKKEAWRATDGFMVDKELLEKLNSLSPSYATNIDPESLI